MLAFRLVVCGFWFVGDLSSLRSFVRVPRWRNHVTLGHDDLVYGPLLAAIVRYELALLNAAIDVYVVALLECQRDVCKRSVEAQAVPVRVLFYFSVAVPVSRALGYPPIGDSGTRRQIPHFRFLDHEAGDDYPVHLHS